MILPPSPTPPPTRHRRTELDQPIKPSNMIVMPPNWLEENVSRAIGQNSLTP